MAGFSVAAGASVVGGATVVVGGAAVVVGGATVVVGGASVVVGGVAVVVGVTVVVVPSPQDERPTKVMQSTNKRVNEIMIFFISSSEKISLNIPKQRGDQKSSNHYPIRLACFLLRNRW